METIAYSRSKIDDTAKYVIEHGPAGWACTVVDDKGNVSAITLSMTTPEAALAVARRSKP